MKKSIFEIFRTIKFHVNKIGIFIIIMLIITRKTVCIYLIQFFEKFQFEV